VDKVIILTGPTATGKTNFALYLVGKYNGELISADSRQVYIGADIVTGKDIPQNFHKENSQIIWHNQPLTYYTNGTIRIWLTDVVKIDQQFNVSFWKDCCDLITADILSRNKLPIIVGGTGLYIKSLTQNLSHISIPYNHELRKKLEHLTPNELFNYLKSIDETKANSLNNSDSQNPRRLLRAIEISESPSHKLLEGFRERYQEGRGESYLTIGLTSSREYLTKRIIERVDDRLNKGAKLEAQNILSKYPHDFPALTACGYRSLAGNDPRQLWITSETQYLKRQLTWFAKMPEINWFDVSNSDWQKEAEKLVNSWYNTSSVSQA
jgi:tRNA dimethylallyltransferase